MAERDEFGAFLIGFVIGGLTGAAVALLLAPQSGEDTRVYLRDQAIILSDKAKETAQTTADQVGTRATDVYAKAKTGAQDLAQQGKAKISGSQPPSGDEPAI